MHNTYLIYENLLYAGLSYRTQKLLAIHRIVDDIKSIGLINTAIVAEKNVTVTKKYCDFW